MKDRAAKVWYFTFGGCSMMPVLLDCMLSCVLFFMHIRSHRYFGAMPVMHFNVIRILCSVLCCIGSQCSFFVPTMSLSTYFCWGQVLQKCFVWSGIFLVCLMVDHRALHWHSQGGLCRVSVPVLCRIELSVTSVWHEFVLCLPLLFWFSL